MVRLGIMGGSFNPIHIGHIIAAQEALCKLKLDEVLFIPAKLPPHKSLNDILPNDRYNMVKLAIEGNDRFSISDMEIKREGTTYTIDTLKEIKKIGNYKVYFIIGFDTLVTLDTWKDINEVFDLCTFVVVNRHNNGQQMEREIENKEKKYLKEIIEIDIPDVDISSTDIRSRVEKGDNIKYLVHDKVEEYILKRGLYRGEKSEGH